MWFDRSKKKFYFFKVIIGEILAFNIFPLLNNKWAGNQRFLSELLVYLMNCPPRLVLPFLTHV